jgi:hypothetical protein
MDSTLKTIRFLRALTLDGLLTSDEVWSLGKFFNENPECSESWPGDILVPMLESAFDDGILSEEEMTLLADTISSIESEWRARNPRAAEEQEEEMLPVGAQPALIPVIDARFEIGSHRGEESYVVALNEPSCTCADWQPRRAFPPRNPGKCCQHIAHAFTRTGKVFEPWFQALLDDCFARSNGTSVSSNWLLLQIPGSKPVLVAGDPDRWCSVFAVGDDGYEKFAFHGRDGAWYYGDAPKRARLIERAIREHFLAQGTQPAGAAA